MAFAFVSQLTNCFVLFENEKLEAIFREAIFWQDKAEKRHKMRMNLGIKVIIKISEYL
jgi:hypothetical protein